MKVLVAGGGTGGHLMPALALADALVATNAAVEPVLVGALRGIEASLLPKRSYRYYLLPLEPIYRRAWWKNVKWPLLAAHVLKECNRVLDAERPALAVGTGGYASGPVLWQALRRGVPVAIQEQNAFPGLTTRWLARRARQVHLGFTEAAVHLRPGSRTKVHAFGNPIAPPPEPRPQRTVARERLGIRDNLPVVLVMGGSQGARSINDLVCRLVESGSLQHVTLLWSTGRSTWERFQHCDAPPARQVRAFWDPISEAYSAADVVIARAGAITTAELCAWGLPSILVPLSTAAAHHQQWNAEALAAAGAAMCLPEAGLTSQRLGAALRDLLTAPARLARMQQAARLRGRPEAARKTASALLAMVS